MSNDSLSFAAFFSFLLTYSLRSANRGQTVSYLTKNLILTAILRYKQSFFCFDATSFSKNLQFSDIFQSFGFFLHSGHIIGSSVVIFWEF